MRVAGPGVDGGVGRPVTPETIARRAVAAALATVVVAACASNPPPVAAPPPPPTFEQKMAAILHLEDRRVLADGSLVPATASALPPLLADAEGRIRRRAALAMGRTGLSEAVTPLTAVLVNEADPEVRAMAAFALGLIGEASAAPVLLPALADVDPRVQGRAAEALGLIGQKDAAGSIAGMAAAHVRAGALAGIASDDETVPLTPAAEAVRLGVYALVRLEAREPLRAVVTGADGRPVSDWWPLAYAVQRTPDPATAALLRTWLREGGSTTRAFAVRGLSALKDVESRPTIEALAADPAQALGVRVQSVRALGAIGDRRSAAALTPLLQKAPERVLRLEAAAAIGALRDAPSAEVLVDHLEDRWPPMRAAAQAALAQADPETFMTVLSGLDVDQEWTVRAALATTLGTLGREAASLRLEQLSRDADPKVRASALTSMAKLGVSGAAERFVKELSADDPGLRLAAARGLGTLQATAAVPALARAFEASTSETTYIARAALLEALLATDRAAATPVLRAALSDRDWAIRVRAAALLRGLEATSGAQPVRPAPAPVAAAVDATAAMIAPPYSPQAYLETTRGEIRLELAVLDAPRTVASFVALAGRGFFDGLAWHRIVPDFVAQGGDPRGDGEGGPGYALRDELNTRPFVGGAVGMALDWKDTGGSQFFITLSPQPHLDARYTNFGQVVAGLEVARRLEPWDRLLSVRVWDGTRWIGAAR